MISELYAFADEVEKHNSKYLIRFDVFPCDSLLRFKNAGGDTKSVISELPNYFLILKIRRDEIKQFGGLGNRGISADRWYKLILGQKGCKAERYEDIVSDTIDSERISNIIFLDRRKSETKKIEKYISLNYIPDSDTKLIKRTIDNIRDVGNLVACYNVGQGNCNAVCDKDGLPLLYFDFGGGVLQNAKTFPMNMKFCLCKNPIILLSHWDLDHWSSAEKESYSKSCKWIAPRQHPIGLRHLKFALDLNKKKKLLIWPASVPSIKTIFGRIGKLPNHTNRNYSGLFLLAKTKKKKNSNNAYDSTLLPGDAPYNRINRLAKRGLDGLVATHHGGWYRNDQVPTPSVVNTIAYSYGHKNSYGHPKSSSTLKHLRAGWSKRFDTTNGGIAVCKLNGIPLPKPKCLVICNTKLQQGK